MISIQPSVGGFWGYERICKLHLHNVQLLPFPSPHWAVGSLSS